MKGLILCAGKGAGLRPLTLNKPKPAIKLVNIPMICYCIQKLLEVNIREIGIVISPQGDELRDVVHNNFPDLHPVFVIQKKPAGIAAAVAEAAAFIAGEPFVLLLGDNIFDENLDSLIKRYDQNKSDAVIMVTQVKKPERFGVVIFDDEKVQKVIEKPKMFISDWAITGVYVFGPAIFKAITRIIPSHRGELEITDAIQWLIDNGKTVVPVKTNKAWLDTGSVENLLQANRHLLDSDTPAVIIGKDCVINNCKFVPPITIGDQCSIVDSTIGPYVTIGNSCNLNKVLTNNSLIMDNVTMSDIKRPISGSIIGSNVSFCRLDGVSDLRILVGDYTFITSDSEA